MKELSFGQVMQFVSKEDKTSEDKLLEVTTPVEMFLDDSFTFDGRQWRVTYKVKMGQTTQQGLQIVFNYQAVQGLIALG